MSRSISKGLQDCSLSEVSNCEDGSTGDWVSNRNKNPLPEASPAQTYARGRFHLVNKRLKMTERRVSSQRRLAPNRIRQRRYRSWKNPGEWKIKMCKAMKGQREVGVVTIIVRHQRLFVKAV
jgi:hypothetical protein